MSSASARFFLILAAFLTLIPAARPADLLVAAASDLATSGPSLAGAFEAATGVRPVFTFHASGMLARQIENGAPYDVYLSANQEYVKQLVAHGDLDHATVVYATGRLGLWARNETPSGLSALTDDRYRNIAIANPAHAPYGAAARQAIEHQNLWRLLQPKIVFAENVRQTFQYGSSGNADAVVTSWTLVFDKGGVMLPAEWHAPIRQAGGVVTRSAQPEIARRFLDFLLSPAGQKILAGHGLFPPPR